jgi:hypothetical protein
MMIGPVEAERRTPIVDNENDRAVLADRSVDKAPQEFPMGSKAISLGAGRIELVGIAHADQIRRQTPAEPRYLRHDVTPEIGRGRVAVHEQKHRLTRSQIHVCQALTVDREVFFHVRVAAMRRGHGGHHGSLRRYPREDAILADRHDWTILRGSRTCRRRATRPL